MQKSTCTCSARPRREGHENREPVTFRHCIHVLIIVYLMCFSRDLPPVPALSVLVGSYTGSARSTGTRVSVLGVSKIVDMQMVSSTYHMIIRWVCFCNLAVRQGARGPQHQRAHDMNSKWHKTAQLASRLQMITPCLTLKHLRNTD